eukprot:1175876-Alexandrium_andersonii.AAC.1
MFTRMLCCVPSTSVHAGSSARAHAKQHSCKLGVHEASVTQAPGHTYSGSRAHSSTHSDRSLIS